MSGALRRCAIALWNVPPPPESAKQCLDWRPKGLGFGAVENVGRHSVALLNTLQTGDSSSPPHEHKNQQQLDMTSMRLENATMGISSACTVHLGWTYLISAVQQAQDAVPELVGRHRYRAFLVREGRRLPTYWGGATREVDGCQGRSTVWPLSDHRTALVSADRRQ